MWLCFAAYVFSFTTTVTPSGACRRSCASRGHVSSWTSAPMSMSRRSRQQPSSGKFPTWPPKLPRAGASASRLVLPSRLKRLTPRGSVRCSKSSRIATASWSALKADPESSDRTACFTALSVYIQAHEHLASERSAARLAHRSGGPGVGSSNLPAPTNFPKQNQDLPQWPTPIPNEEIGTKGHQNPRSAANNPEIIPNDVHPSFHQENAAVA